ncbi:glycosyl transferase [Vibrio sp. YIC-376]|uniref:glycosyl transferase n=1 Tax=Vibrio sp. YIC-376 TaxID=3136162 RepID=UPI00402ABF6B
MFFKKKRKKEFKKLSSSINEAAVVQGIRQSARELKPLTQMNKIAEHEVIVSLTTYSKRIHDVYLVLESISLQTVLPNRVILWLAEDEFSLDTLPVTLNTRLPHGLEVRFCPDYKSFKKIIPTLQIAPESLVITLDDDVIYPLDTIERLLNEHSLNPNTILGNRAHEITFRGTEPRPYKQWTKEVEQPEKNVFLTGCGAILYPPKSLHASVTDTELFMKLCPHADDIWLYIMARMQGTNIRKAAGRHFSEFAQIPNNQTTGLNKLNVDNGQNDVQLKAVMDHFGFGI